VLWARAELPVESAFCTAIVPARSCAFRGNYANNPNGW
jgi:hypothetical protein